MKLTPDQLRKRIAVASKQSPADTVIRNGRIVDVFNLEIIQGDIAIVDGVIVGIGEYDGKEIIDAQNRYVCPAFIDGHVHIESSMVTPSEFAKVVLPHGVTTVIADPHEIGNVSGTQGLQFMIEDSEDIPLDVYFMLPSSVPATPFENSGAELRAEDLEPFYQHPRVIGLAEVMDYPSVKNADPIMLDKLSMALSHSIQIDGHAAGLDTDAFNVYMSAGIRTDHECTTVADAKERLRRGMYLLIREGSVAKDLHALLPVVNERNARRCLFCTDDKHLDDLIEEGSIDHNIRLSIKQGLDPLLAIQLASLNTAECYGLHHKGAVAPNYEADLLLLDDLQSLQIAEVYKSGELVARNGSYVGKNLVKAQAKAEITESVNIPQIREKHLQIPLDDAASAHVIGIIPNSLITKLLIEKPNVVNGYFSPSRENDLQKIAVIERHKNRGHIGLGIVQGFSFKDGAIATTVAHDSHNLVVTGTNDADMIRAIQAIQEMKGGLVVVKNGEVISSLPLRIAGLLSDLDYQTVNLSLHEVNSALKEIGFDGPFNPFLTLSFLTLPVIPALKLTDLGLFDVTRFKHIDIQVK
ncbi:adenine deaminase [Brevibacillus ginsengisoli]|uniref:adenine deaminase n=1 Tax=Brevibacillus ginsengisoli TaxID=363854 RepID=UPI003CF1194A